MIVGKVNFICSKSDFLRLILMVGDVFFYILIELNDSLGIWLMKNIDTYWNFNPEIKRLHIIMTCNTK